MTLVYQMLNVRKSTTIHVSAVIEQHMGDRSCDMTFTKHVTDISNILVKHVTNIRIVIVKHETTIEKHSPNCARRAKEQYLPKY